MNRAVKIRIYPNKEQRVQIEQTIGCSRFIYNQMLADKISYYQKEKKMLRNTPAGYKKEYPWLKEVDSLALANAQLHLESAFRKFFREPACGFPRYKSKKHARNSYTTNALNGNILLQDTHLKLPKMSVIRIKLHRQIPSDWKLKSVTVSLVRFKWWEHVTLSYLAFYSGSSNRGEQHPCWHTIFRQKSLVCYTFVKLWLPGK